jgi:hypothetical protein
VLIFVQAFKRDLVADIQQVKDGDYNDLYLSLAQGDRRSNHGYDIEESRQLAQKLADVSCLLKASGYILFSFIIAYYCCILFVLNTG